jgi:hypothetical protein
LLIVGCASTAPEEQSPPPVSASSPTGTPTFTGPWASRFQQIWDDTADAPLARAVISDEVITPAELEEVRAAFVACMKDFGFKDVVVERGGEGNYGGNDSVSYDPANPNAYIDQVREIEQACSAPVEYIDIVSLDYAIWQNPQNRDFYEITAECLVRLGVEEPGYSGEDFRADYPDKYGGGTDTRVEACLINPTLA